MRAQATGPRPLARPEGVRATLLPWLAAALSAAAASCAETPTLLVIIDTDADVQRDLDELWVAITASAASSGTVCEPAARRFRLSGADDLPLVIGIEQGSTYDSWTALRIVGRKTRDAGCPDRIGPDDPCERVRLETRPTWPESGTTTVELWLREICLDRGCGEGMHCVEGACAASEVFRFFDDPAAQDEGVPCDRVAPLGG